MNKPSEGVKRVVLLASVLSVLSWLCWVFTETGGYISPPDGWFIVITGLVFFYFLPRFICKIVYWIIEGFEKDKEKKSPIPTDIKDNSSSSNSLIHMKNNRYQNSILNLLFSFQGRIGRNVFCAVTISAGIVGWALITVIIKAYFEIQYTVNFLAAVLLLVDLWIITAINAKRLRDIDKSAWGSVLMILPPVYLMVILQLVFTKGLEESNKYGDIMEINK